MSNILFIVGLPGSGKSTLAKKINKDNGEKYLIIRTKLYWRYLNNNPIPGWELDRYGNEIYLYKI
jgi:adenylate kinase family enzyme